MKNRSRVSLILIILLLTLILHILFLYLFTTIRFSYNADAITDFLQNLLSSEQKEQTMQQLQSHQAQSAPVIFRDTPEDEQLTQQPPAIPEPPQTLVAHAANRMKDAPQEQKEDMPKTLMQREKEEKQKPLLKKKEKTVEEFEQEEFLEPAPKHVPEKTKIANQKLESTVLAELEEKKNAVRNPSQAQSERLNTKNEYSSKKSTKPVRPEELRDRVATREQENPSSPLSLADLGKQYMQKVTSIDTGGYGTLQVHGNSSYGHPSAYQIALERYVAKMCKEIETTYKIHSNQTIQETSHKPFALVVELNSNGGISTIYPTPSSGIARIDEFAMTIFRSASQAFPKLPEAMGNSLRIQFGINHIDHLAHLSQGVLSMR